MSAVLTRAPVTCASPGCGHSAPWHGERAGSPAGACLVAECACRAWSSVPARPRLPDPRQDRDLWMAWQQAVAMIVHGVPAADAYETVMAEIDRWLRRASGSTGSPRA